MGRWRGKAGTEAESKSSLCGSGAGKGAGVLEKAETRERRERVVGKRRGEVVEVT